MPLAPRDFREITRVSRETLEKLERYVDLLARWRRAVSLVGRGSLADPWRRHFLDSAQFFPLLPKGVQVLLDIGSGAGFPGLVLAIMGVPEVHLVESNGRKCAFLMEVAWRTECTVHVHHRRIEDLEPFPCDAVTSRAFSPLARLVALAEPFIRREGILLVPKGKDYERELTHARENWKLTTETFPSLTDTSGVILRLKGIAHRGERGDTRGKRRHGRP